MKEQFADLVYAARNLCEVLRDRIDTFDKDDEIKDYLEEVEACLNEFGTVDEQREDLDIDDLDDEEDEDD